MAAAVLCVALASGARAQTPSPLQEWQYSAGIVLMQMFQPNPPDWRVEVGLAAEPKPLYEGASKYRVLSGPVLDVRFKDLAFVSVGEGIGVNLLHGEHYRAGVSLDYDLGRRESTDLAHLKGLGNIETAAGFKVFGSYVVSKDFPLVVRADARRFVGGADGWTGDVDAYLPLPGSSKQLFMFAGPSFTLADRRHMQTFFGVQPSQSVGSGYRTYLAHGGADTAGVGFSATRIVSTRWLVNVNVAVNWLLGSAGKSPITQNPVEGAVVLSTAYNW